MVTTQLSNEGFETNKLKIKKRRRRLLFLGNLSTDDDDAMDQMNKQ